MTMTDQDLLQMVENYRQEAETAKQSRMDQNKINQYAYHMRNNTSKKKAGQSDEFLPKVSMAVEQGANLIQQGLIDLGDWFRVEPEEGINIDMMQMKPSEIYRIVQRQLENISFYNIIGNAAKSGFLGSLIIFKVHGNFVPKAEYVSREVIKRGKRKKQLLRNIQQEWQLQIDLIRQEDYFPDPSGDGLYEIQDTYIDAYKLKKLSEGPDAIYDASVVNEVIAQNSSADAEVQHKKSIETGQNIAANGFRNRVKVTEVWGDFLDSKGTLIHENCVMTIANDRFVIRKPTPNPFWHKCSPFVAIPLISVPHSVWHKAIMDAPALLNSAHNELFNLMLDGGLMAVHGIKQIREDWLDDPSQVTDGIPAGTTLRANSSTPPGAKVMERIDTSAVPPEGFNMMNIVQQEFNVAAMTNDLRQGAQSFRAVKATEVVEASNALNTMFTGIVKNLETGINRVLRLSWMVSVQHMDQMGASNLRALLSTQRYNALKSVEKEDLFEETVDGVRFQTFGISETLNKQKNFTKIQAFLQTVFSSEVLVEEFVRSGKSIGKLLDEVMRSLDINPEKLKESVTDPGLEEKEPPASAQDSIQNMVGLPDMQSQIPQAGAPSNQGDLTEQTVIPRTEFPGSPATAGMG